MTDESLIADEVIENAAENPVKAITYFVNKFYEDMDMYCDDTDDINRISPINIEDSKNVVKLAIEYYGIIKNQLEQAEFVDDLETPESDEEYLQILRKIAQQIAYAGFKVEKNEIEQEIKNAKEKTKKKYISHYIFEESEYERLQNLINEMREGVLKCEAFDEQHRRRVINKLENLQQELHKRVSSLSMLYGRVIEASQVAGKVGRNLDPVTDKARDFIRILSKTQDREENLPETDSELPGPEADIPELQSDNNKSSAEENEGFGASLT